MGGTSGWPQAAVPLEAQVWSALSGTSVTSQLKPSLHSPPNDSQAFGLETPGRQNATAPLMSLMLLLHVCSNVT